MPAYQDTDKACRSLVSSVPHNSSSSQPLIAEITVDQAGLIFGADGPGRGSERQVFIVDGCGVGPARSGLQSVLFREVLQAR